MRYICILTTVHHLCLFPGDNSLNEWNEKREYDIVMPTVIMTLMFLFLFYLSPIGHVHTYTNCFLQKGHRISSYVHQHLRHRASGALAHSLLLKWERTTLLFWSRLHAIIIKRWNCFVSNGCKSCRKNNLCFGHPLTAQDLKILCDLCTIFISPVWVSL